MVEPTQSGATPPEKRLEEYLESKAKPGGTGNYALESKRVIGKWIGWLSNRTPVVERFDQLTVTTMANWAQYLKRRAHGGGITGATAHAYYARVRAFLTWCVKWEYLAENPAAKSRAEEELPDESVGRDSSTQQFWSVEDRTRILRHVDTRAHEAIDEDGFGALAEVRDRALVYLLAFSGVRGAEVLRDSNDARRTGITWRDIDLDAGTVVVLGKSQETDEKAPLPRQAHPAIERWRTILDPPSEGWPVFPTFHAPTRYQTVREGLSDRFDDEEIDALLNEHDTDDLLREHDLSPPSITTEGARRIMKRLCEEADIDVDDKHGYLTLHGARRGVGETLYRHRGAAAAQRALRHADPATTSEMYSHIEASELSEDASAVFDESDS